MGNMEGILNQRQEALTLQIMLEPLRMDVRFHLEGTPYVADDTIGTGAYGVVCKAKHLVSFISELARSPYCHGFFLLIYLFILFT